MWNIHRTYILLIVRIPLLAICCYVAADVLEGVICESIPPYESLLVWLHVISLAASLYLNGTFHFVHRGSTKTMLWFIVQRINPLLRKLRYDFPFTGKNGRGLAHHSRLELVLLWSCSVHRLWSPRLTLALHLHSSSFRACPLSPEQQEYSRHTWNTHWSRSSIWLSYVLIHPPM